MSLRGNRKLLLGMTYMVLSTTVALVQPDVAALVIGAMGGGLVSIIWGNVQEHRASGGA